MVDVVAEAIIIQGISVLCLPPYNLDLNPSKKK